jgi:hypothetical protein
MDLPIKSLHLLQLLQERKNEGKCGIIFFEKMATYFCHTNSSKKQNRKFSEKS